MSIQSLCQGDVVQPQVATTAAGAMGGASDSYADAGPALDCLIQTMAVSESLKYAARGGRSFYNVFFSADPGLVNLQNHRLKWTAKGSETLATPVYLRIMHSYVEGRPGANQLWAFDCESETTRPES